MKTKSELAENNLKTLNLSELNMSYPSFKNVNKSKTVINWMINWIETGLKSGEIKVNDLLPSKSELAYALGVSIGTIQNAVRHIEDLGYLESKQCIGTMIKDKNSHKNTIRKLTSKREITVEKIKKYISENDFKIGSMLPSIRTLSKLTEVSLNTIRLALGVIASAGIAEYNDKHELTLKSLDFKIDEKTHQTLVHKIKEDIKNYVYNSLQTGDKIPPHDDLAKKFKVSIKTIHDAIKLLCDDGILLSRRGRYGTTVLRTSDKIMSDIKPEVSIFASAVDTAFYYYEKTQNKIRQMIINEYEIGTKLPSINSLSSMMNLSPNIIRKALSNLAAEGYLKFARGRYGGTYVVDIPIADEKPYKWLAVNPNR